VVKILLNNEDEKGVRLGKFNRKFCEAGKFLIRLVLPLLLFFLI
jgi:hypothetical protein